MVDTAFGWDVCVHQPCQAKLREGTAFAVNWPLQSSKPLWGGCTSHFRTNFSGDWDVHWGYDLDFAPWPVMSTNHLSGAVPRRLALGFPPAPAAAAASSAPPAPGRPPEGDRPKPSAAAEGAATKTHELLAVGFK